MQCPACKASGNLNTLRQVTAGEVDQCPSCSGIWLDSGELKTIRSQYDTAEDRYKAADKYLDKKLDSIDESLDLEVKLEKEKIEKLKKHPIVRISSLFKSLLK